MKLLLPAYRVTGAAAVHEINNKIYHHLLMLFHVLSTEIGTPAIHGPNSQDIPTVHQALCQELQINGNQATLGLCHHRIHRKKTIKQVIKILLRTCHNLANTECCRPTNEGSKPKSEKAGNAFGE